jgi:hypothetical protein
MLVTDGGPVEAFCGYFDVLFKGSEEVSESGSEGVGPGPVIAT